MLLFSELLALRGVLFVSLLKFLPQTPEFAVVG